MWSICKWIIRRVWFRRERYAFLFLFAGQSICSESSHKCINEQLLWNGEHFALQSIRVDSHYEFTWQENVAEIFETIRFTNSSDGMHIAHGLQEGNFIILHPQCCFHDSAADTPPKTFDNSIFVPYYSYHLSVASFICELWIFQRKSKWQMTENGWFMWADIACGSILARQIDFDGHFRFMQTSKMSWKTSIYAIHETTVACTCSNDFYHVFRSEKHRSNDLFRVGSAVGVSCINFVLLLSI